MIAGVLLAAGESTRYAGGNKLLAEVDGDPVVVRAARTLCSAPIEACLAVLGHQAERVGPALADLPIETTVNPEYEAGQATSVRRGVEWAMDVDADAAVLALGDMPWVTPETYEVVIDAYHDGAEIVVPEYHGDRGNPVLFDATHFPALANVSGDSGGRQLFASHDVTRIPVEDPGVCRDVDEPADLDGS
ncbi:MAG: NTP transferase domain-containing protein [Halobacteriaceae archaeon]